MDVKTKALLLSLFGRDEDGNVSLRIVEGATEGLVNAVGTHSGKTFSSLLSNAIVLDENGNPALRVSGVNFGMTQTEARAQKQARVKAEAEKAEAEKAEAEK